MSWSTLMLYLSQAKTVMCIEACGLAIIANSSGCLCVHGCMERKGSLVPRLPSFFGAEKAGKPRDRANVRARDSTLCYCLQFMNFCVEDNSIELVVFWLDVEHFKHFDGNTDDMRLFAHHISKPGFAHALDRTELWKKYPLNSLPPSRNHVPYTYKVLCN